MAATFHVAKCPFTGTEFHNVHFTTFCNYHVDLDALYEERMNEIEMEKRQDAAMADTAPWTSVVGNPLDRIRGAVSLKKRRFVKDSFDLDLTYITKSLIAMGFPSTGSEKYYRNPADQVERFYDHYHKEHYKVYNLCQERIYQDPNLFHGSWEHFPFEDHSVPTPFSMVLDLCKSVDQYLKADPRNVVGIHCKAGKARTGLMLACVLMYTRPELRKAIDALAFFATKRTYDGRGVTIPSQQRYVSYWEQVLNECNGRVPEPRPLRLRALRIFTSTKMPGGLEPHVMILQGEAREPLFDSRKQLKSEVVLRGGRYEFSFSDHDVVLLGDVKFAVYCRGVLQMEQLFHFWVNTAFLDPLLRLPKSQLDGAFRDREQRFDPNMVVELATEPVSVS
eukprot:GGOE01065382.1.p1 GENE.GGOE01065382.1~~GGOE01065382.1.p1  ORF type:complete len:392 (+),score=93.57 GGOE01065382.1:62-1237(+)